MIGHRGKLLRNWENCVDELRRELGRIRRWREHRTRPAQTRGSDRPLLRRGRYKSVDQRTTPLRLVHSALDSYSSWQKRAERRVVQLAIRQDVRLAGWVSPRRGASSGILLR